MTVTKYVWALLCMALAIMLVLPACGDDDDEGDGGGDMDTDTDTDTDSDADLVAEGGECTIMLAGAIPSPGECKKTTDTCEGGFTSALLADPPSTHNCEAPLDCCSPTDRCEALKEAAEEQFSMTPSCVATGEACTELGGLLSFNVGCPAATSICCLVPLETPDAGE